MPHLRYLRAIPWFTALALGATASLVSGQTVPSKGVLTCVSDPDCIPAGYDCWRTLCGATKVNFCDLYGSALPADFFGLGSEKFEGEVLLGGATAPLPDTQVQRLQDLDFNAANPSQIQIELVQLDLVSCQPITVMINEDPVDWDVEVTLSDEPSPANPAPAGSMSVDRTHANGGTFGATLPFHVKFTFTRVDNPTDQVILDTGTAGLQPFFLNTVGNAPWVSNLTMLDPPPVCGFQFAPGVEEDPDTHDQCCREVGHAGPGHLHVTGLDCTACSNGACCDPSDGSCTVVANAGACAGEFKGAGTDCADTDGDGLVDVQESNNCCSAPDNCNLGTNPIDPDTDGDGIDDGQEIIDGTNPCEFTAEIFLNGFESGDTSAWTQQVPPP